MMKKRLKSKGLINGSKFVGSKILILKGVFGDATLA